MRWRILEDYKAFEAAIIADYDAHPAVERELVLRLASLLWRLRRATTMETGCSKSRLTICVSSGTAAELSQKRSKSSMQVSARVFLSMPNPDRAPDEITNGMKAWLGSRPKAIDLATKLAHSFLRLANLPSYPRTDNSDAPFALLPKSQVDKRAHAIGDPDCPHGKPVPT